MGENDRKQNYCFCPSRYMRSGLVYKRLWGVVGGGVVHRSSASEVDCINGELPLQDRPPSNQKHHFSPLLKEIPHVNRNITRLSHSPASTSNSTQQ